MFVICLFKKLVDKKNDKLNFKYIHKTDEKYNSVRYECISFRDSYRFSSSSLNLLVETLVDNSHKTLKELEEEIVDDDEMINIVNQTKILIKEDGYNKDSTKKLTKDFPDIVEKLEEALHNYMGEYNLKILKREFLGKWKCLTKNLAYPYEYFNCFDDYQKPVDNIYKRSFLQ